MTELNQETRRLLARASGIAAARDAVRVPINYDAMQREYVQQKAALTRAKNSGDPNRVVKACREAVQSWNKPGRSWPDSWSTWQGALDDVLPWNSHARLEDLA